MVAYLVDRISRSRTLDSIVVATTTNVRDNAIIEECERRGIPNFRGSEFDVLRRYVSAARACDADIIVRVTGDNPFTDPRSVDRVVDALTARDAEYAIENNLPVGVTGEAVTWEALSFIDSVATSPAWREHVTLYAKENPHALRCLFLNPPGELARPDLSFTVDTFDEYLYARQLAESIGSANFELKTLAAVADAADVGARRPAI